MILLLVWCRISQVRATRDDADSKRNVVAELTMDWQASSGCMYYMYIMNCIC